MLELCAAIMWEVYDECVQYVKHSDEYIPSDLCGMCARASAVLHTRLREYGVKATLGVVKGPFGGDFHVVVVVGDEYVFDPTATQFGYDTPEWGAVNSRTEWLVDRTYPTVHALREYQQNAGWVDWQQANIGSTL